MHRNRIRAVAVAIAILGMTLLWASVTGHAFYRTLFGNRFALSVTVSTVVCCFSVLILLTTFDRGRSQAFVRLDWFVPMIRRIKDGQSPSHSLIGRWLRKYVPLRFQSNHTTKRRGLFRKFVRLLGISWLASPVRRIVQTACLLAFAWLFLYVCWPYHARPVTEAATPVAATFQGGDQQTGEFLLTVDQPNESGWVQNTEAQVFVVDTASDKTRSAMGPFTFASVKQNELRLRPVRELNADTLDGFLSGSGSFLLHQRDPHAWPTHYADNLVEKEVVPAETFLIIDPLVSLSTAVASRSWVWSLVFAAAILIVCVLVPRGFCGYLCPLGTTIDFFDWAIGRRVKRFRVADDGWWVHIKYYLLGGTLVAAMCGVLISGFVSAIPVITRAMLFIVDPLQSGAARGWHLIPAIGSGQILSIAMFAVVLGLGFLRPRFWCKYVCPSGAVFSLGNLFRVTERKVESSCINCNKCVEICPFDAIKPDFTTRTSDCTMCQSCAGVCPTHAIKFVERWNVVELKVEDDPPTNQTSLGRRGFMSLAMGSSAAVVGGAGLAGISKTFGAKLDDPNSFRPVRPPGSVPEQEFLEMCIRCGECFKACPNNVLQVEGFEQGLEGLWSPMVVADWAGCESSCNACGQVCPTGAIRALQIEEKRVARMGLAIVNEATCLPFAGTGECDLCVQECDAAGYGAIEFTQTGVETDPDGRAIEGTGYLAPVVLKEKCVGCGLCQTRCHAINVKEEGLLSRSAIIIEAGDGKEDRLLSGSYIALREEERKDVVEIQSPALPANTIEPAEIEAEDDDPFGLSL